MSKLKRFYALLLIIVLAAGMVLAQKTGLPRLKKNESYKSVRTKMIKAGWKPFHSPDADECFKGDERCEGRPEMESCAGTGLAPCRFLWKRKGKTIVIFTEGENTIYSGYEFQK